MRGKIYIMDVFIHYRDLITYVREGSFYSHLYELNLNNNRYFNIHYVFVLLKTGKIIISQMNS